MSEKELRNLVSRMDLLYGPIHPFVEDVDVFLNREPDVVGVLRKAQEELKACKAAIAEATKPGSLVLAYALEASVWAGLMEWLEQKFQVRLVPCPDCGGSGYLPDHPSGAGEFCGCNGQFTGWDWEENDADDSEK